MSLHKLWVTAAYEAEELIVKVERFITHSMNNKKIPNFLSYHCIINHEVLNNNILPFVYFMKVATTIVNLRSRTRLKCRFYENIILNIVQNGILYDRISMLA
ncbi:hypothetical protein RF11_00340 [Thelohanellus kitauei]|uniref:Uncharacterized protein n=1 Tax=Thelohanellus kitauei TaxID=669202 RepID=A0A0C2M117_THEKT|nr:hypothetical protein RF11_00340 [Thelohanellus kitauei]